jgi:hypothetical protein
MPAAAACSYSCFQSLLCFPEHSAAGLFYENEYFLSNSNRTQFRYLWIGPKRLLHAAPAECVRLEQSSNIRKNLPKVLKSDG